MDKKLTPCVCGKLPYMYQIGSKESTGGVFWLAQCGNPCCEYRPDSGFQTTHKKAVDSWNKTIKKWELAIKNEEHRAKNGSTK